MCVSLAAGILAVLMAVTLGCTLGLIAGCYGGKVDTVIYNMVNVMMAFPFILLALFKYQNLLYPFAEPTAIETRRPQ